MAIASPTASPRVVRIPTHRLRTPKGIGYSLTDGPSLGSTLHGGLTAKAEYQVAVNDLTRFLDELQPTPRRANGIVYMPPHTALNLPNMYVPVSIEVEAWNTDRPFDPYVTDAINPSQNSQNLRARDEYGTIHGSYEPDARVTVSYATTRDSGFTEERSTKNPIDILEPSLDVNAEALSINANRLMKFQEKEGAEKKPVNTLLAPFARINPIQMLTYRWAWALYPDFKTISNQLGKLNPPDCKWLFNAEAETVMFIGLSGRMEFRHNKFKTPLPVWTLDYKFAKKRMIDLGPDNTENSNPFVMGWNWFFDPDSMRYKKLYCNGLPLYSVASAGYGDQWTSLFRCELTDAEAAAANPE